MSSLSELSSLFRNFRHLSLTFTTFSELSPLVRNFCHLALIFKVSPSGQKVVPSGQTLLLSGQIFFFDFGTFTTLTELSPLLRNFRNFLVMFPFFTFSLPLQVAFASTLTYDPHHDLQHPPSSLAASIWCFHVVTFGTFATFATFSELSPLLGGVHYFHVPFASSSRFCFHTDL